MSRRFVHRFGGRLRKERACGAGGVVCTTNGPAPMFNPCSPFFQTHLLRGCEDHHLKHLGDAREELLQVGPLPNVDLVLHAVELDGEDHVRVRHRLHRAVH